MNDPHDQKPPLYFGCRASGDRTRERSGGAAALGAGRHRHRRPHFPVPAPRGAQTLAPPLPSPPSSSPTSRAACS
jgi:hypothetical protein